MLIHSSLVTLLCIFAITAEGEEQTQKKRGISGGGWVGIQSLDSYSVNQQLAASTLNQLPTLQVAPQLPLSGPVSGGWNAGQGLALPGSATSLSTSSTNEFPGYPRGTASPPKPAPEPLIIEKAVEKLVPIPVERIVHKPYPVPVPIPQTIPVAVEQLIPVPVKTPVAIPVHHAFPIPIKHTVPVPVPIPVPVPVHDHYGLGIAGLSGGFGQGSFGQGGCGQSDYGHGGYGHGGFEGFDQGNYGHGTGQGLSQGLYAHGSSQGGYGNGWNQGWSQYKKKRSKD